VVEFLVHKKIISAVNRAQFFGDRMSYVILRGHCFDIILNVHAPRKDKYDDMKDSIHEEMERVLHKNPK
jgi:23S rRNA C2498 (ribose-2'-O)-methylase RlmM